MHIEPFGVEIWMNEFETRCELNLAETCVESLSIGELLVLAGKNDTDLSELLRDADDLRRDRRLRPAAGRHRSALREAGARATWW